MKECNLYEKKDKGKVRCLACSHKCLISEEKTGICGIRQNKEVRLYLLTYGKIIATHVDPIEKKPLFHYIPKTRVYSIGTVGCNFRCRFCQNYEISQFKDIYGEMTPGIKRLLGQDVKPETVVENAMKNKCRSIAYTYTEPAIFVEYIRDVAKIARGKGLKNIFVTNGYFTKESFEFLNKEGLIDAMNIDLKSFSDEFYKKVCGARLNPVLETIKRAYEAGVHLEITTLVIPGENDSKKELKQIAEFIYSLDNKGKIPWHISRFFPMYKMMDKNITGEKILNEAKEIGEKAGLKNVYLGNV